MKKFFLEWGGLKILSLKFQAEVLLAKLVPKGQALCWGPWMTFIHHKIHNVGPFHGGKG